jgi:hypothetical protein
MEPSVEVVVVRSWPVGVVGLLLAGCPGGSDNDGLADGAECTAGAECASGSCVDGVCCDGACDGGCEACVASATGGADGACAPIVVGQDPDDECTSGVGDCGTGSCDGAGACGSLDDGAECRAAEGPCDVAETCAAGVCPADGVAPAESLCRASTGDCDLADPCDGVAKDCVDALSDAGTPCREARGDCDLEDVCDGLSAACPSDELLTEDDICRPSRGACDVEETCGEVDSCPSDVVETGVGTCFPYLCAGDGCGVDCDTRADCAPGAICDGTGHCIEARRIFVSSTIMNGNLGGLAGADATCASLASQAGLPGTFKAWLSSSTVNVADRMTHSNGIYYRADGSGGRVVMATSWSALVAGSITAAVATDERGVVRGNNYVWTGTNEAGVASGPWCDDWTSSSPSVSGRVGFSSAGSLDNGGLANGGWTDWFGTTSVSQDNCDNTLRLYCVEQ